MSSKVIKYLEQKHSKNKLTANDHQLNKYIVHT